MMAAERTQQMNDSGYSVVIVGAGPVGLTLATLLGQSSVKTLLVEKNPEAVDYPRAVSMDAEARRTFQACGLLPAIEPDLTSSSIMKIFAAKGRCLGEMRSDQEVYGFPARCSFLQPLLEKALRTGLDRFNCVTTRFGDEVTGFESGLDDVRLSITGPASDRSRVRTAYLVGCDGGRSFVRTSLGIGFGGSTFAQRWLVLEARNDPMTQEFNAFYCDPARPAVCIRLPNGYRRWEFMLLPGESEEDILAPENMRAMLKQFVASPDGIDVVAKRIYTFHARLADRFRAGRVLLAGDAAHLMPPFAGQGMNSGIRDASNLAWKLAMIVKGQADPILLDTYEQERREHVANMIAVSRRSGAFIMPTSRAIAFVRDRVFSLMLRSTRVRDYIVNRRFQPPPQYRKGFVLRDSEDAEIDALVGRMFGQPKVSVGTREPVLFDEIAGNNFALVVYRRSVSESLDAVSRDFWQSLGTRLVQVEPDDAHEDRGDDRQVTVVDAEGGLAQWFAGREDRVVILRPDRYVAGVVPLSKLNAATLAIKRLLAPGAQRWVPDRSWIGGRAA